MTDCPPLTLAQGYDALTIIKSIRPRLRVRSQPMRRRWPGLRFGTPSGIIGAEHDDS